MINPTIVILYSNIHPTFQPPTTMMNGIVLASIPLLFPSYILFQLLFLNNNHNNPLQTILIWIQRFFEFSFSLPGKEGERSEHHHHQQSYQQSTVIHNNNYNQNDGIIPPIPPPPVSSQLLAYVIVAIMGYWATDRLIPIIKTYTLRKGISGRDLGKRGTELGLKDV